MLKPVFSLYIFDSTYKMHTENMHAYKRTVSTAMKGSHHVGNFWAHPLDVTQH